MTSAIRDNIIETIEDVEEIHGTQVLALKLHTSKWWVIAQLRELEASGAITIIQSNGGRGHKTIYKRNRNSAGMARKVRP